MVWAASRLLFLVSGEVAARFVHHARPEGDLTPPPGALASWAHWDGAWYVAIAQHGYKNVLPPASSVFFPLYPGLIAAGRSLGGGPAAWGVAISVAASLAGLFFVYRIAESLWGPSEARWSTLALAFFPTSLFLGAVYTEALFLALSAACVWAALVRRDLLLAGILGGLATLTRNTGVLLVLPLAIELHRRRQRPAPRELLGLALVPTGLAVYSLYLAAAFGNPFLFTEGQARWERELPLRHGRTIVTNGWATAREGAHHVVHPFAPFYGHSSVASFSLGATLALVCLALVLALLVAGLRMLPGGILVYAAAAACAPLLFVSPGSPLLSYQRYAVDAFPLFLVLGRILSRRMLLGRVWLVASAVVGVYLTALFTTWRWAG